MRRSLLNMPRPSDVTIGTPVCTARRAAITIIGLCMLHALKCRRYRGDAR